MSRRNRNPEETTNSANPGQTNNSERGTRGNKREGKPNQENVKSDLVDNTPSIVEIDIPTESEEKKTTPKKTTPKKKSSPKKKNSSLSGEDISPLLQGLFGLISMRAGQHWNITEEESNSICTPLANILDKLDISEKVAGASDGIMLVVATGTIVLPRIMFSRAMKPSKQAKVIEQNGGGKVEQIGETEKNNIELSKSNSSNDSNVGNVKAFVSTLHSEY